MQMSKIGKSLAIIVGLSILITGCGGSASGNGEKTVIVTPAITGNSANLNVGDTLEIQLPTIPTPGFDWQTQDLDTTILVQEGSTVYTKDSSPNSAGGIVTLKFTAIAAGKTTLTLLYVSASSIDTPSLSSNSFSMTVEVK
jgi:inhibitor of cysteine peptidase